MKPTAAFALGLWTGAVIVAAVGAFHLQGLARLAQQRSPVAVKQLQGKTEEIQQLRQEQARLMAEEARLRQTVSELKNDLDSRAEIETRRDTREARRRITFRTPAASAPAEPWIADAVTNGDVGALPQLQTAALQGSGPALEALASLADRDNAEALTRVWISDSISAEQRVKGAQLIAATLEVNPRAEQLLQILFSAEDADAKLLAAALDGLLNPRFRADYTQRLRLVDILRSQATDANVLASLDRAREQLVALAAQ